MKKRETHLIRHCGLNSCLLPLFALVLVGCNQPLEITKTQAPVYPDLVINMFRTACMGDCPVYDITIKGDGSVTYRGWRDVEVLGTRTSQITQDSIQELVKEFESINFLEIESPSSEMRDCPVTIISLTLEGRSNEYSDYFACGFEAFPYDDKVFQIGHSIDGLTNSNQWLGNRANEFLERLAQ